MATAAASSSVECVRRLRFCCVLTTLWLIAFDWLMCATTAAVAAKLRIRPHSRWRRRRRRRPLGPNFKTNRKWQFLLFLDMDLITRLSLHIFTSLFLPSTSAVPTRPSLLLLLAFLSTATRHNLSFSIYWITIKCKRHNLYLCWAASLELRLYPKLLPPLCRSFTLSLSAWINLLCEGDKGGLRTEGTWFTSDSSHSEGLFENSVLYFLFFPCKR